MALPHSLPIWHMISCCCLSSFHEAICHDVTQLKGLSLEPVLCCLTFSLPNCELNRPLFLIKYPSLKYFVTAIENGLRQWFFPLYGSQMSKGLKYLSLDKNIKNILGFVVKSKHFSSKYRVELNKAVSVSWKVQKASLGRRPCPHLTGSHSLHLLFSL
jgi:hypothetical protein